MRVICLTLGLIAASCGGAEEPRVEGDPDELVGKWVSDVGIMWGLTDGSFQVEGGSVPEANDGTYEADGFELRITNTPGGDICGNNQVGTYRLQIVDDVLAIDFVSDACGGRPDAFGGLELTRQS